ncbi:MAG: hypothetical protein ABI091_08370 [Ferruginibacter sp.]
MANKTIVPKSSISKTKPAVNAIDKKATKNKMPEKVAETKQTKPAKKPSGIVASAVGASAVDAVMARSSRDVRGSSGLSNTGTVISYD